MAAAQSELLTASQKGYLFNLSYKTGSAKFLSVLLVFFMAESSIFNRLGHNFKRLRHKKIDSAIKKMTATQFFMAQSFFLGRSHIFYDAVIFFMAQSFFLWRSQFLNVSTTGKKMNSPWFLG